jgi:DNA-binding SARP family transcriptional activator
LLAVLVAKRRLVPVDRLADLLWPEIDPATGRERLNAAVYRLRDCSA